MMTFEEAIAQLPDTPEAIAEFLLSKGIVGKDLSCPLQVYLHHATGMNWEVGRNEAQLYLPMSGLEYKDLKTACSEFTRAVDYFIDDPLFVAVSGDW